MHLGFLDFAWILQGQGAVSELHSRPPCLPLLKKKKNGMFPVITHLGLSRFLTKDFFTATTTHALASTLLRGISRVSLNYSSIALREWVGVFIIFP